MPSAGNTPAIVQQTPVFTGSSLTALAGAFPAPVTKGNLVVAGISTLDSTDGANPAVSAVTLGGSADNFGQAVYATVGDTAANGYIWVDPSAQEASAAIAVAMTGGSGTNLAVGQAYEVSNMLATSSAAACYDAAACGFAVVNTGDGVKSVVTNAGATGQAGEMIFGFGMGSAGSPWSLSPPGGNSVTDSFVNKPASGYYCNWAAGWSQASVAGSPAAFGLAAAAGTAYWGLVSGAFFASGDAAVPEPMPFTLAIDGTTYDTEQTTPGVGYTYSLGQSPMYLNTGQNLQLFWPGLDAATYAQYAAQMNITAWFRYDPSVQPSS
ncbi:MAG TPA: hypothetical protein VGG50_11470 [Streptosporangiaceae bacterium]